MTSFHNSLYRMINNCYPKYVFSSLYKSHILAIQFSNNHLIINLLSYYDSSVFDQFSWNLAQMCALVCRCARHIFRQWQKECCHGNGILRQKWENIASRTTSSVFHQSSWNLAQMFALGCRCARHIFLTVAESVAMVMAYYGKNGGKILRHELLPQFFTNSHEIWHRCLPWSVDVQDTFFFDSGRKCVAMVTAYYGKNGGKSCAANYFLSFSPILMKFGTDVCLGVYI